jgi:hypothetical protein
VSSLPSARCSFDVWQHRRYRLLRRSVGFNQFNHFLSAIEAKCADDAPDERQTNDG